MPGTVAGGDGKGIMTYMKAEEANRFYEEDEDPHAVFDAFDAGEKGRTTAPESASGRDRRWRQKP
jgi:hypothetical protein